MYNLSTVIFSPNQDLMAGLVSLLDSRVTGRGSQTNIDELGAPKRAYDQINDLDGYHPISLVSRTY